jgi:predicted dehydrogenase
LKAQPPLRVGIIGCGKISPAYFKGCTPFDRIKIAAVADMNRDVAAARAKEFNVPRVLGVDELLRDPDIDIVLNLTIPKSHAPINLQAVHDGKHVYVEKPFALNMTEARDVLQAAQAKGVRTGSAPDTFLGGGIQTCRKLIDDGAIGQPVAATAFMVGRGHEHWHPSPAFYYQPGGGPMFDMGPYYITALVNLIGPVKRVTGSTAKSFPTRTILSQPLAGQKIAVEVPTHYAGVMDFACGAVGTIIMSFDVFGGHNLPRLEIYGTEGSLMVPDPNTFEGPVKLRRRGETEFREIPLTHSDKVGRGYGLADMAQGILTGRPHRCSGELATHVLEVMSAFEQSSTTGQHVILTTTCQRPESLPAGLPPGTLD